MPPYGKWRSKTIGITNNLANNEWEQMAKEAGFTIANKSQSITPKLTKLYDFLALATKVPGSSTLLRLIAKPNTGYTEPAEKNGSDLLIVLKKL